MYETQQSTHKIVLASWSSAARVLGVKSPLQGKLKEEPRQLGCCDLNEFIAEWFAPPLVADIRLDRTLGYAWTN
jgi:hypothetical protein